MPRKKKEDAIKKKIYKIVDISDSDTPCFDCDKARVLSLDFIPDNYLEWLHDFDFINVRLEYCMSTGEIGMLPVVYICEIDEDEDPDDYFVYSNVDLGDSIIKVPIDCNDEEPDDDLS